MSWFTQFSTPFYPSLTFCGSEGAEVSPREGRDHSPSRWQAFTANLNGIREDLAKQSSPQQGPISSYLWQELLRFNEARIGLNTRGAFDLSRAGLNFTSVVFDSAGLGIVVDLVWRWGKN